MRQRVTTGGRSRHVAAAAGGPPSMRGPLAVFAACQVLALGLFLLLHGNLVAQGVVFVLSRLAATAAVATGAWIAKPAHRREWLLILVAVLLWDTADFHAAVATAGEGQVSGWVDLGYLTVLGAVLTGVAVVRMTRKEGLLHGAAAWLEAGVGSVTIALLWWILNGHGTLQHGQVHAHDITANLYALCDVVSVASCAMLLDSRVGRFPWPRLLAVALTLSVLIDLVLGTTWSGTVEVPMEVTVGALIAMYAFLGAAALLNRVELEREQRAPTSGLGIAVLLLALVVPPAALSTTLLLRRGEADSDLAVVVLGGTFVLALLAAARIRLLMRQLEHQADEIERTARTDELTQLANRRAGTRFLGAALQAGAPLSVALLDLDHFKTYNDTHGHLQGDQLLAGAATSWAGCLDDRGVLFRFGGEEFVAILPGLTATAAEAVVGRMRAATPDGQTFSAGITRSAPGDDVTSVLARADEALYEAKSAGRGCSVVR